MGYSLGVDVGTTYTAVAIDRDGRAEIAPLGDRGWSVPSVVFLCADGTTLVGEPALRRAALDPPRLAREFKRRMGDSVPLIVGGEPMSTVALTGILLRSVVTEVVTREGGPPDHMVLTHPADWNQHKTELLRRSVRSAGLDQLCPVTLMTEPEAAATYYASIKPLKDGDVIAVYDLGGGTFDAAVLQRAGASWRFLAPAEGIDHLGGIDFDEAVLAHIDGSLGGVLRELNPADPEAMAALRQLRRDCIDAKEALSSDTEATIVVTIAGPRQEVRITRAEFESLIESSLRPSVEILRHVLRHAGITPEELTAVVLVGGSSRIPLVAEIVGQSLRVPVAVDAHPKHSVALGAAINARLRAVADPPTSQPSAVPPGTALDEPPRVGLRPRRGRRLAVVAGAVALVVASAVGVANLIRGDPETGRAAERSISSAPSGSAGSAGSTQAGLPSAAGGTEPDAGPAFVPLGQADARGSVTGVMDANATDPRGDGSAGCADSTTIAVATPLTGSNAAVGANIVDGARLAIDQHNRANPACQVDLQRFDTANGSAGAIQSIINDDDILALLGPGFSGDVMAAGPDLDRVGLLSMTPVATDPAITRNGWSNFFRGLGDDSVQGQVIAGYMKNTLALKKVCVIRDTSPYGGALAEQVASTLGSVVQAECTRQLPSDDGDLSPIVAAISAQQPDAVFFGGYYPDAARLVASLRRQGSATAFVMGDNGMDPQFIAIAGEAADGVYASCACGPFTEEFAAQFAVLGDASGGPFSAEAYDLTAIMLRAIDSGVTDRVGMVNYVRSYRGQGVAHYYQWDERGELVPENVWIYQVR